MAVRKKNCTVCGGLLTYGGSCTKCDREQDNRKRAAELCECKRELAQLKASKAANVQVKITEHVWTDLSQADARGMAKRLMDAGIVFIQIKQ